MRTSRTRTGQDVSFLVPCRTGKCFSPFRHFSLVDTRYPRRPFCTHVNPGCFINGFLIQFKLFLLLRWAENWLNNPIYSLIELFNLFIESLKPGQSFLLGSFCVLVLNFEPNELLANTIIPHTISDRRFLEHSKIPLILTYYFQFLWFQVPFKYINLRFKKNMDIPPRIWYNFYILI